MSDHDYLFKLMLVGDSAVGKSCLLNRFSDNIFTERFVCTIGVDFKIRMIELENLVICLQIWDTAGQDRYRSISTSYYNGSNGIVVIYDTSNRETFENVKFWLNEIKKHAADDVLLLLVGNKIDLESEYCVPSEEAEAFAKQHQMMFLETSAKTAENVDLAFTSLAESILKQRIANPMDDDVDDDGFDITGGSNINVDGGCGC
ncbi:hypothetical protein PCE1_000871 [Barthelona sp. PCE]